MYENYVGKEESICQRMFRLMEERDLKAIGLAKILGVDTSQTTSWKKRNTDPPSKYLPKICAYLGCSYAYLLGDTETDTPTPSINSEDMKLLDVYHDLPIMERALAFGYMQGLLTSTKGRTA